LALGKGDWFVKFRILLWHIRQYNNSVVQIMILHCCQKHTNSFDVLILDVSIYRLLFFTDQRCSACSGQSPTVIVQSVIV